MTEEVTSQNHPHRVSEPLRHVGAIEQGTLRARIPCLIGTLPCKQLQPQPLTGIVLKHPTDFNSASPAPHTMLTSTTIETVSNVRTQAQAHTGVLLAKKYG